MNIKYDFLLNEQQPPFFVLKNWLVTPVFYKPSCGFFKTSLPPPENCSTVTHFPDFFSY
jgi:hypothetical protein